MQWVAGKKRPEKFRRSEMIEVGWRKKFGFTGQSSWLRNRVGLPRNEQTRCAEARICRANRAKIHSTSLESYVLRQGYGPQRTTKRESPSVTNVIEQACRNANGSPGARTHPNHAFEKRLAKSPARRTLSLHSVTPTKSACLVLVTGVRGTGIFK